MELSSWFIDVVVVVVVPAVEHKSLCTKPRLCSSVGRASFKGPASRCNSTEVGLIPERDFRVLSCRGRGVKNNRRQKEKDLATTSVLQNQNAVLVKKTICIKRKQMQNHSFLK